MYKTCKKRQRVRRGYVMGEKSSSKRALNLNMVVREDCMEEVTLEPKLKEIRE